MSFSTLLRRTPRALREVVVTTTKKKDGQIVQEKFYVETSKVDWRYRELFSERYNIRPEFGTLEFLDASYNQYTAAKPCESKLHKWFWQLLRKWDDAWMPHEARHSRLLPESWRSEFMIRSRMMHVWFTNASDAFKIRFWDRDFRRKTLERMRRMRIFRKHHRKPFYKAWCEQRIPLLKELIVRTEEELLLADPQDRKFITLIRQKRKAQRWLRVGEEALANYENQFWMPQILVPGKEDSIRIYCPWIKGSGHPMDRFWWHTRFDDIGEDVALGTAGPQSMLNKYPKTA